MLNLACSGLLKPQGSSGSQVPQNKYAELLAIIEELGKEIRPTYAGSKSAMERLKRGNRKPAKAQQFKCKIWILAADASELFL